MPRRRRPYCSDIPCHVTQRGNNRNTCFLKAEDFRFYLHCLTRACERFGVSLHAYVLMTNHVHLLMTPTSSAGISAVIQSVGRRYVPYFNHLYHRTGTLWEGRHHGSIVEADRYLLACMRYIELNPVRAGLANAAMDYPWSSHRQNAGLEAPTKIVAHAVFGTFGDTFEERCRRYRDWVDEGCSVQELRQIRGATLFSSVLGEKTFRSRVEDALNTRFASANRGRSRGSRRAPNSE